MWKKVGICSILLVPVTLIAQLVLLAGLGIVLRAGTGSLNNSKHLPITPGLYVALIDTEKYSQTINKETYNGLPDSHDFSKQKDFFALFPALYCSGSKAEDKYVADYCSSWGKQLFDLQRLWRVWGVDLMRDKLVGSYPTLIYSGLLVTAAANGVSLISGVVSFCSDWSSIISTVFSWIATISLVSTAALSYTFVSGLASHIKNLESDQLVVHWGNKYIHSTWAGSGLALVASILLTYSCWRRWKIRSQGQKSTSKSTFPMLGVVRRATGAFGGQTSRYKHLDEELHGVEKLLSREPSPARGSSVELLGRESFARGRSLEKSTASTVYEPMRHRSVG